MGVLNPLLPPRAEAHDTATAHLGGADITATVPLPLHARDYLRPLEEVGGPSDLPPGAMITATSGRALRLTTPAPFGYDFHWIREVAAGVLRGATGLRVQASTEASVSVALTGSFQAALMRDDQEGVPRVRLVLASDRRRRIEAAAEAGITAKVEVPAPDGPEELLHAMLGIHPLQWLRGVLNESGSVNWSKLAEECGAAPAAFAEFAARWRQLGARMEAVLWKAAGAAGTLEEVREWAEWVASCKDVDALRARLSEELDANPRFTSTPAGLCLEAAAGVFSGERLDEPAFERLKEAARIAAKLAAKGALLGNLRGLPAMVAQSAGGELNLAGLLPWAMERLKETAGEFVSPEGVRSRIAPWMELSRRIYSSAAQSLSTGIQAEIALGLERESSESALADFSVPMDEEGLRLIRGVLSGDLNPLFGGAHSGLVLRRGLLTHRLQRARHIEIHLPFMDRRTWRESLESVARAEIIPDPSGRLFVYSAEASSTNTRGLSAARDEQQSALVFAAAFSARDDEPFNDNFSLTFSDTRSLEAGREYPAWRRVLEAYGLPAPQTSDRPSKATLALSVPGYLAEAWMHSPHSRDDLFFPIMCRVSRAMQSAARRWLPALYLDDLRKYSSPSVVQPLLVYQCSLPYTGIRKGQFCYDHMDPAAVEKALNSSTRKLPEVLGQVQKMLRASGQGRTADYYEPKDTRYILAGVLRRRKQLTALLAGDAFFIEEIVHLANCAQQLRSLSAHDPKGGLKQLSNYTTSLVRAFHKRLPRLYADADFTCTGALMFVEATAALAGTKWPEARIEARLTVECDGVSRAWKSSVPAAS
ncbi:MAG: hypothetical protein HY858_06235 [Candidatus Solibacter usitatus]|nr:hypothetical protein [Candidatus Solibacter usitatus]